MLRNWNVCRAALKSGDIGFAESYIAGDWTTPDLTELLELFIANRQRHRGRGLRQLVRPPALPPAAPAQPQQHAPAAERNIHAHYDLGNAFYQLWLDETMNYSSAWFDGDLDAADGRGAARQGAARPRDGAACGRATACWRSAAAGARWPRWRPREFGASVTGVTLSTEQLACARQRTRRPAASTCGCRTTATSPDAPFDAICSIEMVEAVGREYWPTYFETRRAGCSSPAAAPASRAS